MVYTIIGEELAIKITYPIIFFPPVLLDKHEHTPRMKHHDKSRYSNTQSIATPRKGDILYNAHPCK